jgi:hypothetical protein
MSEGFVSSKFGHPALTPIREHIDPERTRGFVQGA